MHIPHDSISDTSMRYKGCLVRTPEGLARITAIIRCNDKGVTIARQLWKNFSFGKSEDSTYKLDEVDTSKVPTQFVNLLPSKGCVLVTKKAGTRIYSLATKEDNTSVIPMHESQKNQPMDLFSYAISRVGSPYLSRERAYNQIVSGLSPCRAVSKRVALLEHEGKVYLHILDVLIGELTDKDTVVLLYRYKYFKEELEELGYVVNLKSKEKK